MHTYVIDNKGLTIVAINVLVGREVPVLQGSIVLVRGRLAIGLRIVPMIYFGQSHLNILLSHINHD